MAASIWPSLVFVEDVSEQMPFLQPVVLSSNPEKRDSFQFPLRGYKCLFVNACAKLI
jgi:hypothetical protein